MSFVRGIGAKRRAQGRESLSSASPSKDSGDNNEKPPPSQRQSRKQTLPPSFLQPSTSPLDAIGAPKPDIVGLSSDDYSSGPSRPVKKRTSNQGSPSAHKRRNAFGPHDNHNTSVTELTDDKSPFLSSLRFLSPCELALHLRGHLYPISLPCPLRYTLRWIFQVCASPSLTWAVNGECVGATTANRTSMPLLSVNTSV